MNKIYLAAVKSTKMLFVIFLLFASLISRAQNNVGINTTTPNPSAMLDVVATDKGILIPRLTSAQRLAIASPANGLMVFDIDVKCIFFYDVSGPQWLNLCSGTGTPGPTGPTGSDGATGATGTPGIDGINGVTGATGTPGIDGINGVTGATGTPGTNGINGATGATGTPGTNGINGATGATGTPGIDGINGATGATGTPGIDGINGATGATGLQGTPGLDGVTGATGLPGTPGLNGATGLTGLPGTPGINGATGLTGTPGINGINGITGPIGPTGPMGCATANYIIKSNGTTATCTQAPIFESSASPYNVGIGTVTPANTLDVLTSNTTTDFAAIKGSETGNAKVYGVLGSITSTTNNAAAVRGFASGATGSTIGVWGENASSTGSGIYGLATIATGDGTYGINAAAAGASDGYGVWGITSQSIGFGVAGQNSNVSGTGVVGAGNGLAPVFLGGGSGGVFTSSNIGAYGYGDITAGSYGVAGLTANATGRGVYGVNNAAAGTAIGFGGFFSSNQTGGDGLVGTLGTPTYLAGAGVSGFAINTFTTGVGVIGACDGSNGTGVWGQSNGAGGDGVTGISSGATGFGLNGQGQNASGTGVVGAGNNLGPNYLGTGSGGAFTGLTTGVVGYSTSATTTILRAGGYFQTNGGGSYAYVGAITAGGTARKIEGNGTVNTVVKDNNDNLVVLSCPEAPENFFQDFGKGNLVNGKAHITLDKIFTKNIVVNEKHPLRVFVQLEGDCKGVYVSNQTADGFDVTELQGGNSSVNFTWFVTANRADEVLPDGTISKYSSERFAPAMGPQKSFQLNKDELKKQSIAEEKKLDIKTSTKQVKTK
jgi:hypothetical protein